MDFTRVARAVGQFERLYHPVGSLSYRDKKEMEIMKSWLAGRSWGALFLSITHVLEEA